MNTMDQIQIRYGDDDRVCSIQNFLKLQDLSGITLKIQQSLKTLYQLNEKDPPFFHFPDFPEDKPLLVDCMTATTDDCAAHYIPGEHIIEFVKNLHDNPSLDNKSFTVLLAHELTHAEQDVDEIRDKAYNNGLNYHQINLLMEAQAFAKSKEVERILTGEGPYPSEQERIRAVESEIKWLLEDEYYRERWNDFFPIEKKDQMIDSIPRAFHLPNNLLSSISNFPKLVVNFRDISDIRENPDLVYNYFANVKDELRRTRSAETLLKTLIFNDKPSPETMKQDFEIIEFLTKLSDSSGKPLFHRDILNDLFERKKAFEGIDDSPLFKLAQTVQDDSGHKLFPDHFAQQAKKMSLSQFYDCVNHYLDAIDSTPSLDLDECVTHESQPKSNRIRETLAQKTHQKAPDSSQNKTVVMIQKIKGMRGAK